MTALIATDLDRTLIYSNRFLNTAAAHCVEIHLGEPISYMTSAAAQLLRQLSTEALLVPATTRTIAQYTRLALPGAPHRYAITSNGGTLLVNGIPDPQWATIVANRLRTTAVPMPQIVAALTDRIDDTWVYDLRAADNLFCYLVVDSTTIPEHFDAEWRQWCAPRGWTVSRQGRKIYTVPQTLTKADAVAALRIRLMETGELSPDAKLLAAGDGALDAGLLQMADAAIRPAHGELHDQGWTCPHMSITGVSGVLAAEDILNWFIDHIPTADLFRTDLQAPMRSRKDIQ